MQLNRESGHSIHIFYDLTAEIYSLFDLEHVLPKRLSYDTNTYLAEIYRDRYQVWKNLCLRPQSIT